MKKEFDYKALGERIRKERKKKKLAQEALTEECDLSTAHIGHIERGTRTLSIESLITISEVLEVSTDYLLLDVASDNDAKLLNMLNIRGDHTQNNYKNLCSVIKILIENIDKL